ncbi:Transcriptional regulator, MerR family [Pseudonocardia sp. Ae168_Ps1]|uniref:MerR family transcriptional regulator n=1 Tax=unclassified Pseudonocardia TaxID=2619320 RepID=UPI00094AEE83|nr:MULTISPECIES: MerR family transcriptional regulator [unclassified Pseudonocardia]OLL75259.1 Transcriptional regulator, MerR family [Pseudonocardia sp. Ae150A_Ps1]OLL81253.1 Transcriptional regulator, MerR family [Pseudonocardia sp. Ae168_Ps1]OLL84632.1 Transcriptional regulator, MerR family [Pseudonocardia sp. Ae263_Ps1]OLL95351.1 Transcriptional regulator, MerR family [Pseudonocardia sp. Ae356_Ps1]
MLSSELADLAGVTVRTLRHYHQIGLLPEPPRSAGGYRHYDVGHLVRLLRITRMAALGISLSALPGVLDDPAAAEELLDELDRRAAADIERLTARRADIAALRSSGAPPDLPPELSAWRSAPGEGTPADMARFEHEQLVLAGHLLGTDGPAGFTALFGDGLAAPAPLTARFYALGPDTGDDEITALVDDLVAYLGPVTARLAGLPPLGTRVTALMEELNEQTLRPVQHRVLRRVQERLAEVDEG